MGAPIGRLIVANNQNHGLSDLITRGCLETEQVKATLAPAMDIQIPSNLERYLFELFGRDPDRVDRVQNRLTSAGRIDLSTGERDRVAAQFAAGWIDDRQTEETMRTVYEQEGVLIDPHTAIGWEVGRRLQGPGEQLVAIATAAPAKFAEAVEKAVDVTPAMPAELAGLMERGERVTHMAADFAQLRELLERRR
jgi:threonine synthase